MNKTINAIRRNWLWLTLCLLLFTISTTRNFHIFHHRLSWWNVCWIFLPFISSAIIGQNNWRIFRPFRWLIWPNVKDQIEKRFQALDKNMLVYPALIWLNLGQAEQAFIIGGLDAFNSAFNAQLKTISDGLENIFTQVAMKPALTSECCKTGGECVCRRDDDEPGAIGGPYRHRNAEVELVS